MVRSIISKKRATAIALAFAAAFNLALGPVPAKAETAQGDNTHVLTSEKISSGIHYTEEDISNYYDTGNRVRVNKLEIDPSDSHTRILSSKAAETVNAMETIGDQAQREILKGNQVVAGVNADMYDMSTGMPNGLMMKDGELITSQGPDEKSDSYRIGFYMEQDKTPGIDSLHVKGTITVSESVYSVNLFNRNQGVSDGLVIDTSAIAKNHRLTHFYEEAQGKSAFALIRVDGFTGVLPGQDYSGSIEDIYTDDGFEIPEGYVALAGYGTMKSAIESMTKGDRVSFRYDLYVGNDLNNDVETSVAFNTWLVRDGRALTADEMPDKTSFTTGPNARTALGIRADGSLIVVAVDKPSTAFGDSIGTSLPDLAKYMLDNGAVNALNLDGGGSTEMVVRKAGNDRPVTVNHPSDNSSRVVTNALLFASTATRTGVVGNVVVDKNVTLYQGSGYDFSYRVTDEFGNIIDKAAYPVKWETTFGSIDENGRYTAPRQPGSGEVTAVVNGVKGSAKVKVVDSFSAIAFTANASVVMKQNETKQFEFTAVDASGGQVTVDPSQAAWSLAGDIGTVNPSGLVTATAEHGTGTLTATVGGQTITAAISVGLKEQVIDDFETYPIEGYHLDGYGYGSVSHYAGSAGTSTMLSLSSDNKHSGQRSFRMDYDFSGWTKQFNGTLNWRPHWYTGSQWPDELAAQMDATYKTDVYPKKFGVWVYGDGKAPWLRAIFKDGSNSTKTIDLTKETEDINWVGWKYIEADIPQGWQLPIRLSYIYSVETDKAKAPYSGSIYFDDLKFLYTDEATDYSGPEFTEITPSSDFVYGSTLDFSTVITDNLAGLDRNRMTVKVNDRDQAYQYDESTGRLSFKLENLAEGDYRVFIEAYDLASNQSVPWIDKTYHVDLSPDTDAPTVSKVTPTSDVTVKIPTPRVTFRLLDEKSTVDAGSIAVKLNDVSLPVYYDASTGWGYAEPETKLPDGEYALTIDAKDGAGNTMPTYSDHLTIASIAQPKDGENFSISVIPDTHLSPFAEPIFKRAAADDSSLIIHLGDIVDGGSQEEYDSAAESAKWFGSKPFFVLAGNHEAFKNTLDIYFKTFGSPTMQFEYGDTQIIILNSAFGQSISASDSTQFHYLEEVLAKNTKPNVLVFSHVVSRDDFGTAHEMNPEDVAKFESILGGYKKQHQDVAIYTLFGHLHTVQTWDVDGVKYFIGGNAANKTYVSHADGDLLGSGKITVADGEMSYGYDPLLTKVYIKNEAVLSGKMKAVVGSRVQLDLYGDFRVYPSQYVAQLNTHDLVNIAWSSSDEDVASVDQDGVVTFHALGKATITGTSGGKSSSFTVETVDPADVKPIKLELVVNSSVRVGHAFIPTIKATDAYGAVYALNPKDVTFSFKNGYVTQDADGKLLGAKAGEEEITAQFGGLQAVANLTVIRKNSGSAGGSVPPANQEGANETYDLSKNSLVPADLFAELSKTKGKTMTFAGGDYQWTIRAEDVANPKVADPLDLSVKMARQAPIGKVATPVQVNPDQVALGFALNHLGALPGKMTLEVNAGETYAGQALFLYAVRSADETPALQEELLADENGRVAIPFASPDAAEYMLTSQKVTDFADADSHWAKSYIYDLTHKGIVNGVSEKEFMPNRAVTRGEFVTLIARAADADVSAYSDSKFADVGRADWYAPYIAWASEKGIVLGTDADTFAPNANMTREQMAVILVRMTDLLGYKPENTAAPVRFGDEAQISAYAVDAVKKAQQAGIIVGMPDNRFAPSKQTTRAEAAKVLADLLKMMEK